MASPSILCPQPWLHRFINVDGSVQVCCLTEEVEGHVVLRDDGRPFRVDDDATEDEITNSSYMRRIKRQMIAGEWPQICRRCRIDEGLGGTSRRQIELGAHHQAFDELLAQTSEDGSSPARTRTVDIRLGNICNLKCRMCHPCTSTRWIPEYHHVLGRPLSAQERSDYARNQWTGSPQSWRRLRQHLGEVTRMHFAGGEPLIIPEMLELLRACVTSGHAKHITLSCNTNLTVLTREILDLWSHFREVDLLVSLDGAGPVNDYIRAPSRWTEIAANLALLESEYEASHLCRVAINCTVQLYNVLRLGELLDTLCHTTSRVVPVPLFTLLYRPRCFDARLLSPELKTLAIERLRAGRERWPEPLAAWPTFASSIDKVCAFLEEEIEDRDTLLDEFARVSAALDACRGESLLEVVPELGGLLATVT